MYLLKFLISVLGTYIDVSLKVPYKFRRNLDVFLQVPYKFSLTLDRCIS